MKFTLILLAAAWLGIADAGASTCPYLGNKNAAVSVTVFSDFQCPYCRKGSETVAAIRKKYGGRVKIVFRHLPIDGHEMAVPAAIRFEAIALQSFKKAFKFHDIVFAEQNRLNAEGEAFLDNAASRAGADVKKMQATMRSQAIGEHIVKDAAEAAKMGIGGTPTFVVNNAIIRGAKPLAAFEDLIDSKLAPTTARETASQPK